eukprot:jgi/Orpsp1_1/1189784/evm.model.d7180000074437.1
MELSEMKFITILTTLLSVTFAQYCPITSGTCNTSNVPSAPKTAKLVRQYLVDGYECKGTIKINNECEFTVLDFKVVAPGSKSIKWYGVDELNSSLGGNFLGDISAADFSTNTDITVRTDNNIFCRASLVDHVGAIVIMDDDYRVICSADFSISTSPSTSSTDSSSSLGSTTETTTDSKFSECEPINAIMGNHQSFDCCMVKGINCDISGSITEIDVSVHSYGRPIPPEIGNLSELEYM